MDGSRTESLIGQAGGSSATIRQATVDDVAAIHRIYNHYVAQSVAVFSITPEVVEERNYWFHQHAEDNLPVCVAEDSNGQVIGWASLSRYSGRCGYKQSVEASVYIDAEHLGRGHGKALLDEILRQAASGRYHCVIASICTENERSIQLFKSRNFEQVGILREVGRKFDRWLDVMLLQKLLPVQDS